MLLVGRGGYGKDTDNTPNVPDWHGGCMGGDSAIVAYHKNFEIGSSVTGMWGFNTISFRESTSNGTGLYVKFTYHSFVYEVFLGDQKMDKSIEIHIGLSK